MLLHRILKCFRSLRNCCHHQRYFYTPQSNLHKPLPKNEICFYFQPSASYEVTIQTGTLAGAGTDSTVLITIQGTLGSVELQFSGSGTVFDSGRYRKRLIILHPIDLTQFFSYIFVMERESRRAPFSLLRAA